MRSAKRLALWVVFAYGSWMAMMALHETGHAMHAVVSGGKVERMILPVVGFSRTDLAHNPHPQWVAWGGAVWGCVLPLFALAAAHAAGKSVRAARGFAGLCLVANGVYIGLGWTMTAGDGHDLVRSGAPVAALVGFGVAATAGGLYLWHRATDRK